MLFAVMMMVDMPEDKHKVEQLYEAYDRLMYSVANKILNHHEDTEDALMLAWERMIKHLDKISEIFCPETKSFIVIVVERAAIDIYRKNKRRIEAETLIDDYDQSPFLTSLDKEMGDFEMKEVFRNLPKKYGEVLSLSYMNDMNSREIGEILGISTDAVDKRLQRGRAKLRRELGL